MIILDVGVGCDLCGLDCQKEIKIYRYFEMSFSCFGLFRVWGETVGLCELIWTLIKMGLETYSGQALKLMG